ncbi:MAG: alpha/beta hydrolase [Pseudomonadota bacterium]
MNLSRLMIVMSACAAVTACGGESRDPPPPPDTACHAGGYRMADGEILGLVARGPDDIRYVFMSGVTGGIYREDDGLWRSESKKIVVDLGACGDPAISFSRDAATTVGVRIPYTVTETMFDGVDGKRAGRLTLPTDQDTKAIVIAMHGSERWSGRTGDRLQSLLPAFGIGVFSFDKRGTGASDGKYTQDFNILSDDAVRARNEARRLFDADINIGYFGPSQGGWVAPLTASKDADAAFVIAAFGLAISPSREDQEEVLKRLREAGYGEDVLEKAREVTDATRQVVVSNFKGGYKELSAVRKKYQDEDWYALIEGEYSGELLRAPNIGIRIVGPLRTRGGNTTWTYEPRSTLEALETPQLWILADEDRSAPSASTLEILQDIQKTNKKLDIVMFPNTDHGIIEFTEDESGVRTFTRVADGYYALIRDYILTGKPTLSVEGPTVYSPETTLSEE